MHVTHDVGVKTKYRKLCHVLVKRHISLIVSVQIHRGIDFQKTCPYL